MREILFRGKRIDNDEWVYGNYVFMISAVGDKPSHSIQAFNYLQDGKLLDVGIHDVSPETVGQYTGLKDIEGVKIFEGDIVILVADEDTTRQIRMHDPEYPGHDPADVVKWHDKEARYYLYEDDDYTAFDFCHEHKIIGNIHDNPELV